MVNICFKGAFVLIVFVRLWCSNKKYSRVEKAIKKKPKIEINGGKGWGDSCKDEHIL
jgi:hypothetical protein